MTSHFRAYPTAADLQLKAPEPLWVRFLSRLFEGILIAITLIMLALVVMPSTAHAQSKNKEPGFPELLRFQQVVLSSLLTEANECARTQICSATVLQANSYAIEMAKEDIRIVRKLGERYHDLGLKMEEVVHTSAREFKLLSAERAGLLASARVLAR